jgi:hypothetical protein
MAGTLSEADARLDINSTVCRSDAARQMIQLFLRIA